MSCPDCGADHVQHVIYAGFPMWLCCDCNRLWGFWSWAIHLPIPQDEFVFVTFTGSYWRALWRWLTHDIGGVA